MSVFVSDSGMVVLDIGLVGEHEADPADAGQFREKRFQTDFECALHHEIDHLDGYSHHTGASDGEDYIGIALPCDFHAEPDRIVVIRWLREDLHRVNARGHGADREGRYRELEYLRHAVKKRLDLFLEYGLDTTAELRPQTLQQRIEPHTVLACAKRFIIELHHRPRRSPSLIYGMRIPAPGEGQGGSFVSHS